MTRLFRNLHNIFISLITIISDSMYVIIEIFLQIIQKIEKQQI